MLASRNRILAAKSRSFKDEDDQMEYDNAPLAKSSQYVSQPVFNDLSQPYYESERRGRVALDSDMTWMDDARQMDKSKNLYSSSQSKADYLVSDQARSLSTKRARLATDYNDDERPSHTIHSSSQAQRLKSIPPSLNMDAFSLNSNTFDNRKLKADLERAKRWIKQAEESYDELANLRYTEAEKNLASFRQKAQERFESSEKLIKSLQETQRRLDTNLANTREQMKSCKEELESLRKENAALQEQAKPQVNAIDPSELEQFHRWKANKGFLDSESSRDIIAERDQLRTQVAQLTATVRLREQERIAQIEMAKANDSKKQIPGSTFASSDGHKNDKTEMYEDLTGLLLTDIKKTPESIVYNCLQTGRNGTLHFKLTQSNHLPNELHYQPMLDRRRDADLIMRLPDYLTTEIEFTREKANLFFWRLLTFLQSSDKKDNTARH